MPTGADAGGGKYSTRAGGITERGWLHGTATAGRTEAGCLRFLYLGRPLEEKYYQEGRKV